MRTSTECERCLAGRLADRLTECGINPNSVSNILLHVGNMVKKYEIPTDIKSKLWKEIASNDRLLRCFLDDRLRRSRIGAELAKIAMEEADNVPRGYMRFRWLSWLSAAASSLGWSLQRYTDWGEGGLTGLGGVPPLDDTEEAFEIVSTGSSIVLVAGGLPEYHIDSVLLEYLTLMGRKVSVIAKFSPIFYDVTVKEVREISPWVKVAPAGDGPNSGFRPSTASGEAKDLMEESDLVISKGVENFISLQGEPPDTPTLHLLSVGCGPVARAVGVPIGSVVAFLVG